jgi:hypothetical protein
MEHVHYWGPHVHWLWFIPSLFMILMFLIGCRMFRRALTGRRGTGHLSRWRALGCCSHGAVTTGNRAHDAPGEILDLRYVRGEITKEQYEQMKNDIVSGQSQPGPEDVS